jgi:hypothetical protein
LDHVHHRHSSPYRNTQVGSTEVTEMMTIPYHNVDRFIADPLSDPLCHMLADEAEDSDWATIDALIETQLAQKHVKAKFELNFD